MAIDYILLFVTLILVALGAYTGLITQVFNVVAVVIAFIAAPFIAPELLKLVGENKLPLTVTEIGSWIFTGFFLYFVLTGIGRLAVSILQKTSITLTIADRVAGAILGLLKALIFAYILLVAAIMVEVPLTKADPENILKLRDGHATKFFKDNNIFLPWQFPNLPKFNRMLAVSDMAKSPLVAKKLREQYPTAADQLRDPKLQELFDDKALVEAGYKNDWSVTAADFRIRALFNDQEFLFEFEKNDWISIYYALKPSTRHSKSKKEESHKGPDNNGSKK